jgi:hypothetical protein
MDIDAPFCAIVAPADHPYIWMMDIRAGVDFEST